MTGTRSLAIGTLVALGALSLAVGVLHAREGTRQLPTGNRLLYLHSGEPARRLFLSLDALAADIYWLRAIQHYGRDRGPDPIGGRFQHLYTLLDITTTLDPNFNVAYRFGAILLALEPPDGPGRPDLAIALLEKGLSTDSSRWQYAHDIGFVHYWHTGRHDEAARWFLMAASMPEAPEWVRPLAARTLASGGDRAGARTILHELRNSNELYIRRAAERALRQLAALDDIDALQSLVERFRVQAGRSPDNWQDLQSVGLLRGSPVDPTGVVYAYQRETGRVSLSSASTLSPLPQTLSRP